MGEPRDSDDERDEGERQDPSTDERADGPADSEAPAGDEPTEEDADPSDDDSASDDDGRGPDEDRASGTDTDEPTDPADEIHWPPNEPDAAETDAEDDEPSDADESDIPDWVDDPEYHDSILGVDDEATDAADDEATDADDEATDATNDEATDAADDEATDATDDGDEWVDENDDVNEIGASETSPVAGPASGGAPAGAQPAGTGAGGGGGMFGDATAPDDQEMPLTQHVEEMALRFMAVGLVVVGVGAITLFYADELINFLWYSFLGPGMNTCLQGSFLGGQLTVTEACPNSVSPRVYHPLALVLARLKVASLVGLIAALPVAVYQMYRFMRPGLYPRERRYYLAAVPTSLVLAVVGVSFAYFAILPAMFSYFTNYSERAAEIAFGLTETFNLMILMVGFFALTFQIPLLVMLAIMMGVTTRRWLEDRRLYFWGGFAAIAFVFSPDPTGMAPLMVAVTMIGLFEGTLFLLRWTDSDSPLFSPVAFAERRPYAWAVAAIAGYLASSAPLPGGYYEQLPAVVRETLRFNDLVAMTPIITAAVLVLLFEVMAYMVRNNSRNVQVWHAVNRSRFPYWMLALVVGYFASPNPPGLQVAQQMALPIQQAAALTAGLIVAFELLILVLRWRKKRMDVD